jgi:plastocyanin
MDVSLPVQLLRQGQGREGALRAFRWGALLAVIPLLIACAPAQARSSPSPTPAPTAPAVAAPTPTPATATSPASPNGASAAVVSMTDALKFEPASLTVAKGTTVTWRNTTQTVHTVTDDPAKASNKADAALPSGAQAWDSGNIDPGQSFSHTFDTPGTYKYFCQPHEMAGMTATIVVTG